LVELLVWQASFSATPEAFSKVGIGRFPAASSVISSKSFWASFGFAHFPVLQPATDNKSLCGTFFSLQTLLPPRAILRMTIGQLRSTRGEEQPGNSSGSKRVMTYMALLDSKDLALFL
jgi:hypothetical protein